MGLAKGFVLAVTLLATFALLVIFTGMTDVAATHPHGRIAKWVLGTAMVRAVERNASAITVPRPLPPPATGASDYAAMCALCHGAPGQPPSELAQGLMPRAPSLAESAGEWSDAELYWIILNGVKMTGMPAWGPTHSEQELWGVVSFLRVLPRLTAEQYAAMTRAGGAGQHHHP